MKNLHSILNQGKGKTLMTVFPHPDDESMPVGGLLAAAKREGWKTVVVSLTAGGAGRIHVKGNGKSLKDIRRAELLEAGSILGADQVEIGDFDDGRLREEPWWKKFADEMFLKYRPDMVVTYDPSGFYGHPDHIAVSKYVYGKFCQEKDWQLWFVAIPEMYRKKWKISGMEQAIPLMMDPTHWLDPGWDWLRKWRAVRAHKSQRLGKGLPLPLWLFMALNHTEWYHEVSREVRYKYQYTDYKI